MKKEELTKLIEDSYQKLKEKTNNQNKKDAWASFLFYLMQCPQGVYPDVLVI